MAKRIEGYVVFYHQVVATVNHDTSLMRLSNGIFPDHRARNIAT